MSTLLAEGDARPRTGAPAILLGAASVVLVVLYARVAQSLVGLWAAVPYYSYGVLVPLYSAYLVWEARRHLRGARPALRREGVALLAGGLGVLGAAHAADSLALAVLSIPLSLAGLAWLALGRTRFRTIAFPVAFLALMTPLPPSVVPGISVALQHAAAWSTEQVIETLGIDGYRDGLFVHLRPAVLHINETCNGLRFLLAMLVVGVATAWSTQRRPGPRLLVIALALGVAIAANMARVAGTALVVDRYGPAAAVGLPHVIYGKVVYGASLVPFLAAVVVLRRRWGRARDGGGRPHPLATAACAPPGLWAQWREDWVAHGRAWTKPGFHAVALHRFGVWARSLPRPLRLLLIALYGAGFVWVRNIYGIELYHTTSVGRRVVIGHQGGIVIHPSAVIGDDCIIRQNVTIGAATVERVREAPRLGARVEVGAGAVVIGRITVGDDARIGPNAVVMTSVPPGATAFAAPARVIARPRARTAPAADGRAAPDPPPAGDDPRELGAAS
jgi:serine O-acetyltransferase